MSAKSDFEKFLKKIGADPAERNTKHECWRIGQELLRVPTDLSGMRTFRNYRAEALRMARRQKLLTAETVRQTLSEAKRRRRPRRRHTPPVSTEEATPEEVAAWRKLEQLRWQRQQERMGMDELKRTIIRDENRIPLIERVLREAAKPLTSMEVCGPLGWEGEHHRRAVLRVLRAYPSRFKPTRGQKKNERYELAPPDKPTPPVSETATPRAPVELAKTALPAVESWPSDTPRLIELIRQTVERFGPKSSPQDAVLIIGEIRGLIKSLAAGGPHTPPAAQS